MKKITNTGVLFPVGDDFQPSPEYKFSWDNHASYTYSLTPVATLSSVSIYSGNVDPAYAKVGDIINLAFSATNDIGVPVVTIEGHSVTNFTRSGLTYIAKYVMQNTDTAGNVDFTIDFVNGAQVTTTTDMSAVTFDKTAPVYSTVTIASNNADTTMAKVGDSVILTVVTDTDVENVAATIN